MSKKGEFVDYGSGHNPQRGIKSYKTANGETLKFTNDGKTMSTYDRDPSDPNHAGSHVTDNGDGIFSVKIHGPNGDKGNPPKTGHW